MKPKTATREKTGKMFEQLDEKGFVFLDSKGDPYYCRMWGESPWLFYWHPDNHWVSLREVTQMEIWHMPVPLSSDEADLYHNKHRRIEDENQLEMF